MASRKKAASGTKPKAAVKSKASRAAAKAEAVPATTPVETNSKRKSATNGKETAQSMALKQREISVSEFFSRNRHLLGFDNPRRALLTGVKEAVDNSLDACEEAGILPQLLVEIEYAAEDR